MKAHFAFIATILLSSASFLVHPASAQNTQGTSRFSFDVYGDSRSMMYLPYKKDQEADARKLMVDMFDLVLPEKEADAVVQKHVKLVYDPLHS